MKIKHHIKNGRIIYTDYTFTPEEAVVKEIHDHLLDAGMSQGEATRLITGASLPLKLRSPSPVLDKVLTNEFLQYLNE